jgi:hypothetical protein
VGPRLVQWPQNTNVEDAAVTELRREMPADGFVLRQCFAGWRPATTTLGRLAMPMCCFCTTRVTGV